MKLTNPFKYLFAFLLTVYGIWAQDSSSTKMENIIQEIHPYIKALSNGPEIDEEITPGRPNSFGEYSYSFRIIVVSHEVWDMLFIERIGQYDEEGLERRITNIVEVPLDSLKVPEPPQEFRNITISKWIFPDSVTFMINNQTVGLKLKDEIYKKIKSK